MTATQENRFTPDLGRIRNTEFDLTTPRGVRNAIVALFVYRESLRGWVVPPDPIQEGLLDKQQKEAQRDLLRLFGQFSDTPHILERTALRDGHEMAIQYWDQLEESILQRDGEVPPTLSVVANWRRSAHRGALELTYEIEGRRP